MNDLDWLDYILGAMNSGYGSYSGSSGGDSSLGGLSSMSGAGMGVYDSVLSGIDSLLGGLSKYYEDKQQEEYRDKLMRWQKEMERIENTNKRRAERARRRSEVINSMGGGFSQRSPKMIDSGQLHKPTYTPDPTAEYLKQGQSYVQQWRDLVGGMQQSPSSQSTPQTPQVDVNTYQQMPTYAMGVPRSSTFSSQTLYGMGGGGYIS